MEHLKKYLEKQEVTYNAVRCCIEVNGSPIIGRDVLRFQNELASQDNRKYSKSKMLQAICEVAKNHLTIKTNIS